MPDWTPDRWPATARVRVAPVVTLLAAIRARRRWQTAMARLTGWGALALGVLAVAWGLQRLDVIDGVRVHQAVLVLAGVGLLHAVWQRHPWRLLARDVDQQLAAHDALSTSLWLAQSDRQDGWALVQAARAGELARSAVPGTLAPWTRPRALPALGMAVLALVLATWVPLDGVKSWAGVVGRGSAHGVALTWPADRQPFTSAAALLGEDTTKLLAQDAAMLADIGDQVTDEATKKWLADVQKVVDGVADGQLDKRQALEMLAALEAQKPAAPQNPFDAADAAAATPQPGTPDAGDSPGATASTAPNAENQAQEQKDQAQEQKDKALRNAVSEAVKEAVKAAPKGELQEALKDAAEKKDLGLLAKLAEKLAQQDLSDKELEKWIKVAEKFAGALKDQKVPDKFKDLAQRVERLQKKRDQEGGLGQSDQERLKSARRELEQLKREEGDALAAEHQVQRLERGAKQAADELRRAQSESRLNKDSPEDKKKAQEELKKAMRAAASELRREQERQQDRQAQRIAQGRMRDMREALERSGAQRERSQQKFERQASGRGERGPRGDRGEGDDQQGQQKGGKEPQQSAEARDAKRMAEERRKSGSKGDQGEAGEGDKPGDQAGQKAGQKPGQGGKRQQLGQGSDAEFGRMEQIRRGLQGQKPGQGADAGDGPGDDRENGKQARVAGGKREQLRGQAGAGPDTKQVFLDAAKKGFARQGWRDVYVEYSQVADEMLDQEQVPPGRRAVVRHYFELIRPRKGWAPAQAGK